MERRVSSDHDEENDSGRENVYGMPHVLFFLENLRRHVPFCTETGLQITRTIASFDSSGETEVSYSQVEIAVEKDVLRLEVSVTDILSVKVLDSIQKLFEEVARGFLREFTRMQKVFE